MTEMIDDTYALFTLMALAGLLVLGAGGPVRALWALLRRHWWG